jgi:hypothetical protein
VIAVLDAPSVLGLRPPAPGKVPGALRLAADLTDTVVAGLRPRAG